MNVTNQEEAIKAIADQVSANLADGTSLGDALNRRIQDQLREALAALPDDDPIVRKMRFGKTADPKLVGSKFSARGFTAADIEWLHDHMEAMRRVGKGAPSEALRNAYNAVSDAYYLTNEEVRAAGIQELEDEFPRIPKDAFHGRDRELVGSGRWRETRAYERAVRAMDTTETGFGLQLIGAQYVGDLWDVSRQLGVIAPLFRRFGMTAPSAFLPVEAGFPEMFFVSESTEANSSDYTTVKTGSNRVQVDAKKFTIHQKWSGELQEDSIIDFVPFLRNEAARSLAFYTDSAILNGDTTNAGTGNINLDDADPADTKHYLAFDGIRHAPIVDNTANAFDVAGSVTLDTFRAIRALMRDNTRFVDWGHPIDRNDLVFVADPDTSDRIDLLDEVVQSKLMAGGGQDLLNGQTAAILGHPVIRTFVQSKTEADGKVSTTAGNNTKGQITAFNRTGGVIGDRRRVTLELERLPGTDQWRHVYFLRMGFGRFTPTGAASGIEWAAVGYNLTV